MLNPKKYVKKSRLKGQNGGLKFAAKYICLNSIYLDIRWHEVLNLKTYVWLHKKYLKWRVKNGRQISLFRFNTCSYYMIYIVLFCLTYIFNLIFGYWVRKSMFVIIKMPFIGSKWRNKNDRDLMWILFIIFRQMFFL